MLTRLFPSHVFPTFGTFCMERAEALSLHADVRVMVPTPLYPSWLPGRPEWKKWATVERDGTTAAGLEVSYPRYASVPGTATWFQGVAMARSVRSELVERFDAWRPDVIDGHFAFPDGYAATRLGRAIGTPVVVTCHGSDLRQYPDIPIAGGMTRWTLRTADRVISVSSDLHRRSIELGCPAERAMQLSNGVDPTKFQLRNHEACRAQLGLPQNRKIATQVAAMVEVKDHSLALHAIANIHQRGIEPPLLVLVGDGPLRSQLQQKAQQLGIDAHVRFVGQRPHAEVALWMGAADWLLLTSRAEGWATVYYEAMACGRPVITSNVSSAKDAICSPEYGAVVEPRTPEAFAQAMLHEANRTVDERIIRNHAEQHSWSRWAVNAMEIFESLKPPRVKR